MILSNMILGCFSQNNTPLSKTLKNWIKNPKTEISEELNKIPNQEVKYENESKLICEALDTIKSQLQNSFDETLENNIFNLTALFQTASTKEAALYLNDFGIPLLIDLLETIESKNYELKSYSSCEPMILKMFAFYKNKNGLHKLSELVNSDFKSDNYLWNVILSNVAEDEAKYSKIINGLNGKIPAGLLGISYLDMCNSIAIKINTFEHPFNSSTGFAFLDNIVKKSTPENVSYVVSATASIPFLAKEYQEKLLESVNDYNNIDIQIEAAWAGTKIGKENSVDKLVNFSKDYRYSTKAVSYLQELHLENKIPNETNNSDFQALSEMCSWLSHPNEFGSYPDQAEIFDKKSLYWPPTKDTRVIYLIKYKYKNHNEDGSDEVGIGLVGSVTFSLFGLENMLQLSPIELMAIHCNWELEKENYQDIKSGIEILKKYNKDLE